MSKLQGSEYTYGEAYRQGPPSVPEFPRLNAALKLGDWVARATKTRAASAVRIARSFVHRAATIIADLTRAQGKVRDWQVDFPRTEGKKGERKTICANPQCYFRGEKLIAFDGHDGKATRIHGIFVGQKIQRGFTSGGALTAAFGPHVLGNGMTWDTCDPALTISIDVEFLEDATWEATCFGKAVA